MAQRIMHALLLSEMKTTRIEEFVQWGTLPSMVTSDSRRQILESYVSLYLDQEIRAEGLTRSMESFARFLEVAAMTSTQRVNFVSLSSDVGKSEKTVAQWFAVFEDTLIGRLLPYFARTVKRKAMVAPKVFFFDCGIANALLDRFSMQMGTPEAAMALENLVFTHLSAWCSYGPLERDLFYWRSVHKDEVNFVLTQDGHPLLAIEAKSKRQPKPEHLKGLRRFAQDFPDCQKILLCLGEHGTRTADGIRIENAGTFLHGGWDEYSSSVP